MASSAGFVASVPISRERRHPIIGLHHQHLSKCKRACTSLAEEKITKLKAPRGMYSAKTPPAESPPATKSPPPVLRERPKPTQPSPPNDMQVAIIDGIAVSMVHQK